MVQRLRAIPGVRIAEPRGAFYAYPNISVGFRNGITSALQFSEKLLSEAHVAVVPGEAFGTTEHVRISYATSMKELERGLDRIERFILGDKAPVVNDNAPVRLPTRFLEKVWGTTDLLPWYPGSDKENRRSLV